MGKRSVLAVSIVMLLILSPTSVVGYGEFEAKMYIRRGQDDVYLDIDAVYRARMSSTARYSLDITYNSYYEKPSRYSEVLKIYQETLIAEYSQIYPPAITKYLLRLDYDLRNGMLSANVVGDVNTINGSISINIGVNLAIEEVSTLSVSGYIDVDKNLIPRDAVQQISATLAMLNPYVVNYQLAQQGVTWLNVSKLRIEFVDIGTDYRLSIAEAVLKLDLIGFAVSSDLDLGRVSDVIAMFKEIEGKCRAEYSYDMHQENKALRLLSSTNIVLDMSYRDLEKFYRELQGELSKPYLSLLLDPRYSSEVSHLLEVVLLPSSASAKIEVVSTGSEVYALANIRNIRLGHARLRGDEAVERVTSIVLSLIEVVKRYGFSIHVSSEVEVDYNQVEKLARSNTRIVEGVRTGEWLSPTFRGLLVDFGAILAPIRYITKEIPTGYNYTETYTATPSTTTVAPYETIPVSTVVTTTVLSTVYRIVYQTMTTTLVLTSTATTYVAQQNVFLAIIPLVSGFALGIALGYLLLKRKSA